MRKKINNSSPTIVFGVTSSESLKLLGALPEELINLGWNVHAVSSNDQFKPPGNLSGVTHHEIPMARRPAPLKDFLALIKWLTLLRELAPDLVSIGTPKAALLGLFASLVCRVPTRIYMLRGLRLEATSSLAWSLLYFFEWFTASSSTHIVAVSKSLKESFCSLRLAPPSKVAVIGRGSSHGVNTENFSPTRWRNFHPFHHQIEDALADKRPILGFVGRLSIDKGITTLLVTRKLLVENDIDHEFVVIGKIEACPSLIMKLNSAGRPIIFLGHVDEVAPYYAALDLLLLPTRREGFPNVVIEAGASEVAAITTDVTGAIDSVVDGKTGIVADRMDDLSFAKATMELLCDPQRRKRMGRSARSWVIENYNERDVVRNTISYYKRAMEMPATKI